jgi:hypothetical protein
LGFGKQLERIPAAIPHIKSFDETFSKVSKKIGDINESNHPGWW